MRAGCRLFLVVSFGVLAAACGEIKQATPAGDAGQGPGEELEPDGGTTAPPSSGGTTTTVEDLLTGRNRPGARSTAGFRAWRSGLAVHGDRLYWVESGTAPGLYSAPTSCTSNDCVEQLATFTRPSAFTATDSALYTSDTTVIRRLEFTPGAKLDQVATGPDEVVNLASDGQNVFWTAGSKQEIWRTVPGGSTSGIIRSNGTPVAMGVAGDRLYWAGVDISGQLGAIQSIKTSGTGAREESRFSSGFHVMRGNATYLYYAKDDPATLLRVTLATGRTEVVASEGLGVSDLAIDDTHVYWVEPGDGSDIANGQVRRVAHDSKEPETLAVSMSYPVALAVSGKDVFVASGGTRAKSYGDGKISKITIGN